MKSVPSTEERVWAVLSHLSALALGMGILLPVIGWSEQRRKSNYASFQSLQALGYQSLGYTVWILLSLLIVVALLFITLAELGAASQGGEELNALLMSIVITHVVVTLVLIGLYFLLPVIAAIACGLGRDFRYPILGHRLARYLGYELVQAGDEEKWLMEDHEDRWVAAMGHFSIIIVLWGMLAPLTAWILQGKRSLFLRFQAVQTLVYQVGVTILFFGSGIVGMLSLVISPIVVFWVTDPSEPNASVGMAGIIALLLIALIAIGVTLIVPLFHILGQWAGYRVLKGDNYRYPVVGKLVHERISRQDRSIGKSRSEIYE